MRNVSGQSSVVKKLRSGMLLLAVGLSFAGMAKAAGDDSPNSTIESAVDSLVKSIDDRRDELAANKAELYKIIDAILLPRFDRDYAAQLILGSHWRDASKEQRSRFTKAFYQSLMHRYADSVLEFRNDRVQILPFRGDASKQRATVKTTVKMDDGTTVAVNYGMVKRDAGWKMFDVTIEGVSYIRNYRTEVDSEIRKTSLDALITRLESGANIDSK